MANFAVGDHVQVVKIRSLAYGRCGLVLMVSGPKRNRQIKIRFSDLPELSDQDRRDPTGFVHIFDERDLLPVEDN